MFRAVFALVFAAFGSGYGFQFLPDIGAAKSAAEYFFQTMTLKDERDWDDRIVYKSVALSTCDIEFQNVCFTYPSRKQQVLKDVSFKIESGK